MLILLLWVISDGRAEQVRTGGASEDGLGRLRDVRREVKPPNLYYGGKFPLSTSVVLFH